MSVEVTWEWEYWQEVSRRSGALVLARFGRKTRVVDFFEDNMVDMRLTFNSPIHCFGNDQMMVGETFRVL